MAPAAAEEDPDMREVGRRISSTREALGWTSAHLARLARINRTELFHLEKGEKRGVPIKPSCAVVWRVTAALAKGRQVPVGALLEELWTGRPSVLRPPFAAEALAEDLERRVADLEARQRSTVPRSPSDASTPPPGAEGRPGGRPSRPSPRSS